MLAIGSKRHCIKTKDREEHDEICHAPFPSLSAFLKLSQSVCVLSQVKMELDHGSESKFDEGFLSQASFSWHFVPPIPNSLSRTTLSCRDSSPAPSGRSICSRGSPHPMVSNHRYPKRGYDLALWNQILSDADIDLSAVLSSFTDPQQPQEIEYGPLTGSNRQGQPLEFFLFLSSQ